MHLLATSVSNIGPFLDQTILVNFVKWSHLIQAPIWSWKSFLFFDGPLFGLYKHRTRPILNKRSKQWKVQVLFETDQQHRLIERTLVPTKKWGESVKTKLWSVSLHEDISSYIHKESLSSNSWEKVIYKNAQHLDKVIPKASLELIEFTSSKEIDQTIQELLPPKEVIMSTNILMQESLNVFELPPWERVQVFKHLFWLIWIDEAKDKIFEKRRELQTMIQLKSDTTQDTSKLQSTLWNIKNEFELNKSTLQDIKQYNSNTSVAEIRDTHASQGFFSDLHLIWNEISIKDFNFASKDRERLHSLFETIEQELRQLAKTQWVEEERKKQQAHKVSEISRIEREIGVFVHELSSLESKLNAFSVTADDSLSKQKKEYLTQIQDLEQKIPRKDFEAFWQPIQDSSQLLLVIQDLIHQWSQLWDQKKSIEHNILQIEKSLEETKLWIINLEKQHEDLKKSHKQQTRFECDKINEPCPYVDLINQNAVSALDRQLWHIQAQQLQFKDKLPTYLANIKDLEESNKQIDTSLDKLKKFLKKIEWKKLQMIAEQISIVQSHISEIHVKLEASQHERDKYTALETQKVGLQTKVQSLTQQKTMYQNEVIENNKVSANNMDVKKTIVLYETSKKWIENTILYCRQLQELSEQYNKHQKEVKILQEQLQISKDLYQIFSKELMIVVLQDFLPALQEVLNSYLSQIVEYEIRFLTPGDSQDQLELDIQIVDKLWVRSVKSLSWWQKTILKLVRMLWVASLFRSSFLLLDETINNLDTWTISQVADIIEEFVKSQDITFYVVTHSPQIQQMEIRDNIINI